MLSYHSKHPSSLFSEQCRLVILVNGGCVFYEETPWFNDWIN